jgi:hypothetical protein
MTKRITFICLLACFLTNAQKFQTVVEVQEECGQLSFMSNQEAEIAVDDILEQFGLTRTFIIQECSDIKNAVANIIQISPNYKERSIFYDSKFLDKADGDTLSKWGSYFILAHEIGHNLKRHLLDGEGSTLSYKLAADYFSGTALGLLGATLMGSQRVVKTRITYEREIATHPKKKRNNRSPKQELTRKGVNISAGNNVEIFEENKNKKSGYFKNATLAFIKKKYNKSAKNYLKAYQHDSEDLSML